MQSPPIDVVLPRIIKNGGVCFLLFFGLLLCLGVAAEAQSLVWEPQASAFSPPANNAGLEALAPAVITSLRTTLLAVTGVAPSSALNECMHQGQDTDLPESHGFRAGDPR